MSNVAIITDSNSGITQIEAKELGINVVPMPFTIDGLEYKEDINLSQEKFYELLTSGKEVFTSMPALGDLELLFDQVLKNYDQIVYIPMSSGLSSSYSASAIFAEENYPNKVFVVNNQRISVTLRSDVLNAIEFAKQGKTGEEIKTLLEASRFDSTIYVTVDDLTYLKKGGRITPAVATIAGLLKIKPILSIYGEKLDLFQKARTLSKCFKIMIDAVNKDIAKLDPEGLGTNIQLAIAHSCNLEDAEKLKETVLEIYPKHEIIINPISLSVACHTGPGAIGLGCIKKADI